MNHVLALVMVLYNVSAMYVVVKLMKWLSAITAVSHIQRNISKVRHGIEHIYKLFWFIYHREWKRKCFAQLFLVFDICGEKK